MQIDSKKKKTFLSRFSSSLRTPRERKLTATNEDYMEVNSISFQRSFDILINHYKKAGEISKSA